ncbi:hypothetical protein [Streptomyces sp. NPDC002640]
MNHGDHHTPAGPGPAAQGPQPYDPWQPAAWQGQAAEHAAWQAEQHRLREEERRRRTRRTAVAAAVVVVAAVVALGAVFWPGGNSASGDVSALPSASAAPADGTSPPPVDVEIPDDAPPALAEALRRPVITPEQAFPDTSVTTRDTTYRRVDASTTTDCTNWMSQQLADLIAQGGPCARQSAALYTDPSGKAQVTVTVLSFARQEDAIRVFSMAAMDPVSYQVVALDPPPASGLDPVPPGSAGVFRRVMTVRSVVFASGQWTDGAETGEKELTAHTERLLEHVNATVVAHEDPAAGG